MSVYSLNRSELFWHHLIILLMSGYLLADMAAGSTNIYLGIDMKVSLIYKIPVFFLLLLLIGHYSLKTMLSIISGILFVFIGPFYQFTDHTRLDFLFADFALTIKLITPVTVFLYFRCLFSIDPKFSNRQVERILWWGFSILFINFILAVFGVGKSTYQLSDGVTAGSTGLIMAGNELGGAFLVTFGFALHKVWNCRSLKMYLLLCVFTILAGITVATKTTMLASILLVFLIPLVNEQDKLFKLTLLKLKVFVPMIIIATVIVYLIFDLLQSIGIYERVMWFYQQHGALGIILSGRDIMVMHQFDVVINQSSLFEQVFGQGQALGLKGKDAMAATEVDGVDVINFYGIFTLIFLAMFYLMIFFSALKSTLNRTTDNAPYVFIISFILLALSQLSGHIWTSGTLGIVLGVMCSCLHNRSCN
jgi:hypothetical protein